MSKLMFVFGGKLKRQLSIGLGFVVLTLLSGQLIAEENASQLFLAPSEVPESIYTPTVLSTPGSVTFNASQVTDGTIINNLAILPELLSNPSNPVDGSYTTAQLAAINSSNYSTYFALSPMVDYSASDPGGGSSTVTFNQPGMYFVQLLTDAGNGLFQVNVADALAPDGAAKPTGPERRITAPPDDVTTIISAGDPGDPVTDPATGNTTQGAMVNAQQQLKNAQTAQTIQEVVNDIKKAYKSTGGKFEVSLIGHGKPGSIKIGTQRINDQGDTNGGMTVAQFQKAIDCYVSSIHFYSCDTGEGPLGDSFLKQMAKSIGWAQAYDGVVTIAIDHFDASAKAKPITEVPEPATMVLLGLGGLALLRRRRG